MSPELALIDSSIRERLVAKDPTEAPTPATLPSAPDEEIFPATRRRGRHRILVGLVALAVVAFAATAIYIHRERSVAEPGIAAGPPHSGGTPSTATPSAGRAFAWAPVVNATSYDVAILSDGKTVYRETTSVPRLTVPARWSQNGKMVSLTAGTYQWFVWPVFGSGAAHRRGAPVVATTFNVG